ncbi:hypothetical protein [Streptomyces gobiensis]|uniref:hypothetical protein n=1 Tax=Streptomyces gobiensis TaxID=2875706 RepID=UPI001E5F3BCA|nr:hypothetical protein [Streptomyces gobiensis]UGY91099.1 hypothetical protein test1122_04745 [Streptomyces gobiensis]
MVELTGVLAGKSTKKGFIMPEQEQMIPNLAPPVTRTTVGATNENNDGAELSWQGFAWAPFAGDDAE